MLNIFPEYLRYNTHGLLGLAAGFIAMCVGFIVIASNPSSKTNKAFFYLTFVSCAWVICPWLLERMMPIFINRWDTR